MDVNTTPTFLGMALLNFRYSKITGYFIQKETHVIRENVLTVSRKTLTICRVEFGR